MLIHDLPLAAHLDPRRAHAKVVDASVAAFVGQSQDEISVGYNDGVVRISAI